MSFFTTLDIDDEPDLESNSPKSSPYKTQTEPNQLSATEQESLLKSLSESPVESESPLLAEEEPLTLDELEDDKEKDAAKNPLIRIFLIAAVSGVVIGILGMILLLFNSGNKSLNPVSGETTPTETSDPLILAQQQAERKQAQLILLGEDLDSNPSNTPTSTTNSNPKTVAGSTPSTVAVPNRVQQQPLPQTPPPPTAYPPTRPTTVSYTNPPPRVAYTPTRTVSYAPARSFSPAVTPRTTNPQITAAKPKIDPVASRERLQKRGWSGFASLKQNEDNTQNTSVALANQEQTQFSSSESEGIPTIRLGDPMPSSPITWDYYATNNHATPTTANNKSQNKSSKTVLASSTLGAWELVPPREPGSGVSASPTTSSPSVYPIGTQLRASLEMPIVYADDNNTPFTLKLSSPVVGAGGKVVLASGTTFNGRVTNVAPNGLMSAVVTSISYVKNGKLVNQALKNGTMIILSKSGQPLRAKVINPRNGDIARTDLILGLLGAASRGFEILNQPETETQIVQTGNGFTSSASSSSRERNVQAGVAEGFFDTVKDRWENRLQQQGNTNTDKPVYFVPAKTEVIIFINAVLEIH